jgi:hypothetical protein
MIYLLNRLKLLLIPRQGTKWSDILTNNNTAMKIYLALLIFILSGASVLSQRVGIGTTIPDPNAQLDIFSHSKGILIPRMNSNERLAITLPADGLLVYDTDTHSFWHYNSFQSKWIDIATAGQNNQQYSPIQKTIAGGAANDRFGFAVSSGGGPAIVAGAPGRNLKTGSVYVGREGTGNVYNYTEFPGADFSYTANDQFGYSVAINKDFGNADWVAGAPFDDNTFMDQGSIVVKLTHATGTKMYSPAPQANEVFGAAVGTAGHAFQNDLYVIVGAPGRNSGSGAAYIYWYNGITYVLMQTISPVAPNPTDSFGHAVSISYNIFTGEGWAFVGAPNDDVFSTDDGSVSIYKRNTTTGSWDFQLRMSSAEPVAGGHFGYAVASNMLCSAGVAIGEPGHFILPAQPNVGRVYYSHYNGSFFQNPVIVDSGDFSNNYFGNAVSVASNQSCNRSYLVVGAKGGPIGLTVTNWGMSKFYTRLNNSGNWLKNGKTFDPEGESGWQFGYSVGVSINGRVIIGSPSATVGNNASQGRIRLEIFPGY